MNLEPDSPRFCYGCRMPRLATSRAKADAAPPLELVVDRQQSPGAPAKGRPLPWAACLLVWAMLAAAGWGAVAFLFHWI